MQMVSVLLQFIRAEREGNWQLHLSSFTDMLPWFAAYNHNNYTRWGAVYLADMQLLKDTHPDVYLEFCKGNFSVVRTLNKFNRVSTDQALEHINRISKVAGGLVGITRTDSARDRWCLTFNERSRIANKTCAMFDVQIQDEEFSGPDLKELSPSKIARDEADVKCREEQLRHFGVFMHTEETLLCIATNDVAPLDITLALMNAKSWGEKKVNKFVSARLCKNEIGFHKRIEGKKPVTLQNMYRLQAQPGGSNVKMVKSDRNLFQRLLLAKESGRDINLKGLLEHELSPVPLSLADSSGQLRTCDKAALQHILEEGVCVDTLSAAAITTCTIIDGQALVQALGRPSSCSTFGAFADIFAARVFAFLDSNCTRVDVIFYRNQQ